MNNYPYRALLGAGLAMLVGVAGAQTYGNQPSSTAVDKNAPQNVQAQPSASNPQSRKIAAAKSTIPARHAAKPLGQAEQTAMQGDKAYREALRQCAKEQDQNARGSCLDNAIEQFHRNT